MDILNNASASTYIALAIVPFFISLFAGLFLNLPFGRVRAVRLDLKYWQCVILWAISTYAAVQLLPMLPDAPEDSWINLGVAYGFLCSLGLVAAVAAPFMHRRSGFVPPQLNATIKNIGNDLREVETAVVSLLLLQDLQIHRQSKSVVAVRRLKGIAHFLPGYDFIHISIFIKPSGNDALLKVISDSKQFVIAQKEADRAYLQQPLNHLEKFLRVHFPDEVEIKKSNSSI